jgi:hypothetical protein
MRRHDGKRQLHRVRAQTRRFLRLYSLRKNSAGDEMGPLSG